MGFLPMDPLVGGAEGADALFDMLHEVKDHAALMVSGMEADRTELAYPGQGPVHGRGGRAHSRSLPIANALPSSGPTAWYPLWAVS
jgi:hypothetical protein